jgi:hypothetical protein
MFPDGAAFEGRISTTVARQQNRVVCVWTRSRCGVFVELTADFRVAYWLGKLFFEYICPPKGPRPRPGRRDGHNVRLQKKNARLKAAAPNKIRAEYGKNGAFICYGYPTAYP